MLQNISIIQNYILSKLKNAKQLRYSELQPEKIANDLFNYHLQFLVKKGLLDKKEEGYALSDEGIKYVADSAIPHLFKINVITIVSRVVNGKIEILNQVRNSNPSFGKIGVMGGVVMKGELIEDAATRKLKQETGLEAKFKHIGCERRITYKDGEIFSDLMFPITYADSYSGTLVDTDFGHNMWVPIDQAIINEFDPNDSISAIRIALQAIRDKKIKKLDFYFTEEVLTR